MSTNTKSSCQTFRPYLTASEIRLIMGMLDSLPQSTKTSIELHKKLSVYEFKIANNLASPSYIPNPAKSISEKLGFTSEDIESLSDSERYEFLCNLSSPSESQIAEGQALEIKLFGNLVGGI